MSFLNKLMTNMTSDKMVMLSTKTIRLGPSGTVGTEAPFNMVKAGVFSRNFVLAV